jgi:integrase
MPFTPDGYSSAPPAVAPRLLDRVHVALRTLHRSPRTEEAYAGWIRRFILFHGKRHPSEMGGTEIETFLAHLAEQRRVSASTQNQALSALLFLYRDVLKIELAKLQLPPRAQLPEQLPVVLTRPEIRALLEQLEGTHRLIATLLYGAGLRLLECLQLRIKDIDLDRHQLVVRRGKGQKDRYTLPPSLAEPTLRAHLARVQELHRRDLARGLGRVALPDALDRKSPTAGREWR